VEIEEEGGPGGRLMFRDGRNNGNVVLGVGGVEERVETTGPGGDIWLQSSSFFERSIREGTRRTWIQPVSVATVAPATTTAIIVRMEVRAKV
jgi:hypothetical protein